MGRPKHLVIENFGSLYSISPRDYEKFLDAKIHGRDVALATFGARFIGIIDFNISDLDRDSAIEQLHQIYKKKG